MPLSSTLRVCGPCRDQLSFHYFILGCYSVPCAFRELRKAMMHLVVHSQCIGMSEPHCDGADAIQQASKSTNQDPHVDGSRGISATREKLKGAGTLYFPSGNPEDDLTSNASSLIPFHQVQESSAVVAKPSHLRTRGVDCVTSRPLAFLLGRLSRRTRQHTVFGMLDVVAR